MNTNYESKYSKQMYRGYNEWCLLLANYVLTDPRIQEYDDAKESEMSSSPICAHMPSDFTFFILKYDTWDSVWSHLDVDTEWMVTLSTLGTR